MKKYYCIEPNCNNEICRKTAIYGKGRCSSCAIKNWLKDPKKHPSYKGGITLKKYFCKVCGKKISVTCAIYGSGLCRPCSKKGDKHCNWKGGNKLSQKRYRDNNKETIKRHRKRYYTKIKKEKKWILHLYWAQQRCRDFSYYIKRNIQCFLTKKEIKFLWDRDNAESMIQPSLHRKEENDHYRIGNCEFMEWEEHKKLHYKRRNRK